MLLERRTFKQTVQMRFALPEVEQTIQGSYSYRIDSGGALMITYQGPCQYCMAGVAGAL